MSSRLKKLGAVFNYKRKSVSAMPSKSDGKDRRVSVCTDCGRGIYTFHEYIWTSRGLVHRECEVLKVNETKGST